MAYDKAVDSSVLDAGLKQIADAIRAKAGTSDNLAFPTAMAEAIAAIEAGGGLKKVTATVSFPTAVTSSSTYLTDVIDGTVVFAVLRSTESWYDFTAKETASASTLSVYVLYDDGTELIDYLIRRTSSTSGTARPLEKSNSTALYLHSGKLRYYADSSNKLFGDYELTYFVKQ